MGIDDYEVSFVKGCPFLGWSFIGGSIVLTCLQTIKIRDSVGDVASVVCARVDFHGWDSDSKPSQTIFKAAGESFILKLHRQSRATHRHIQLITRHPNI